MTAILETNNLSIQFGGVVGASEISVTVNKGEVIGVIGANGAGKTTFVNLVTGYLMPSSGTIHYMGNDVTRLTPREITDLGIRRSFQIPQLFGEMTAVESMLTAQSVAPEVTRSFWMPLQRFDTMESAMERLEHFGIADSAHRQGEGSLPGPIPHAISRSFTGTRGNRVYAGGSQACSHPDGGRKHPTVLLGDEKLKITKTVALGLRNDP